MDWMTLMKEDMDLPDLKRVRGQWGRGKHHRLILGKKILTHEYVKTLFCRMLSVNSFLGVHHNP
ncbi:MAG TPA: hypothetical protein DCS15_06975 [Flavobacteriales bacterium]|nr:hypothetical protein [Flavobacteriales bacterium]